MDIRGWDDRYRAGSSSDEPPTRLLQKVAAGLAPGKALDLASGPGRNALWLAENGWDVTAVDGSEAAIDLLRRTAAIKNLSVTAKVLDLKQQLSAAFAGAPWDLIAICNYLQRDLFAPAKQALREGGVLLAIVHTTEGEEEPTHSRLRPGELEPFFEGWEILHSYQGKPDDPAHRRAVTEVVARKPLR